jgi:fimbrial chaperone protein
MRYKTITIRAILAAAMLFIVFPPAPRGARAGDFWVSPIRLELDGKNRSSLVRVSNNSSEPMRFQVEASAWGQDADGKDEYSRTVDLHFYPRILEVKPGESRVIRAGVKMPAVKAEKTYRLFIRDISHEGKQGSSSVAISVRFGVPVFVRPAKVEAAGSVETISMEGGKLSFSVVNRGNVHFKITGISITGTDAEGAERFAHKMNGWYLLNGKTRVYEAEIPAEQCAQIAGLMIVAHTDTGDYSGSMDVDGSMCGK